MVSRPSPKVRRSTLSWPWLLRRSGRARIELDIARAVAAQAKAAADLIAVGVDTDRAMAILGSDPATTTDVLKAAVHEQLLVKAGEGSYRYD